MSDVQQVAGTCVAFQGAGVLLLGESGGGKSDLALRVIHDGWQLVADDQVILSNDRQRLLATAPDNIAGLLEIRHLGLVRMEYEHKAKLELAVTLARRDKLERLPETRNYEALGISIPHIALDPFDISAVAKLKQALYAFRNQSFVDTLIKACG